MKIMFGDNRIFRSVRPSRYQHSPTGYDCMPPHIPRSERPSDCLHGGNVHAPSIGLSDLMNHMSRFIALRATLVSDRSLGAVEHRIHPASRGLKDHPDTSIAQRAMAACHPIFLGLKDRWIVCMPEISTPPSIGLSDLMNHMTGFIALRAMLISDRSVGAVEFLIGFIALRATLVSKRSVGAS